ncbi:MAG: DNA gyrase/topoisomerase IV subunit A [Bacteroidetes bacterium]|nr:DNA gyrase/topoisomerase IV subunit A [Bacteroidota bacterium]MBV6461596.1 DNA gyrase subunit A [Flavobacteriales bacterium]NOG95835.1 DNA gyrase/topoisomerase IV subunit A [Bacteroidota bacterium]GIK70821.1 MAG: DNA topoisomerase IV subunit A [Bacteroidota bacterium]
MAEENNIEHDAEFEGESGGMDENIIRVSGMYREWFLDYASYVILERAIPHLNDGLKPVQRRILHSMFDMEDGRYHKVANIIGNTMKFHPHGDAAIGDALVQLGQKDILIDTQGNWGNIYTGDSAAAPRYIEARLSKFALEVVFNPKTTEWQSSYDGRSKEPVTFPVKFPLLLAQGVEGIAVGMACKILPHNFNELIEASIAVLKGKTTHILPDFPTGGMADFSNYNDGLRGGRIRVRARIKKADAKTLLITEIPFGTNTGSLIDSIIKANDKGKIKIKKVEDNTAENVEIAIYLAPGVSPDKTIDALYAFTDCEVSVSPNAAVIESDKPRFLGVNELLKYSTHQTLNLLRTELEIKKAELQEQWHFSSLEKIFIEKRIYRKIEECETWEEIIDTIHKGLKPYAKQFHRVITDEDVTKLTEIRIKRISKFDSFKADELIKKIEEDIAQVQHHLDYLTDYAIEYFKNLKKKYGEGRERKTEIKSFETIDAAKVAVNNVKLYANLTEGFVGYGMRNEGEFVCDCSDIDDIIVFRKDGTMLVSKISAKAFLGKELLYVSVWRKGDKRTIYHLVYQDGKAGAAYIKRFPVTAITRDKEYPVSKGSDGSKVLYFTANPNGEAEIITVIHKPKPGLKKLKFDFDFSTLAIKGRDAQGNILTKVPVQKIIQKEKGASTLSARKIWFDDSVQRLNADARGLFLGEFKADDKILTIMQTGEYLLTGYDLSTHFEEDMILIEKWNPQKPLSVVYFEGEKKQYFIKRFVIEPSDKKVKFISEHPESRIELVTTDYIPRIGIHFSKEKGKEKEPETINITEFIAVKGLKAVGNRLSSSKIKHIDLLEPLQKEPVQEIQQSLTAHFEEEDDPTQEIKSILNKRNLPNKNSDGNTQITLDFD